MKTYLVPVTKTTLKNVDVIELIAPPPETKTYYFVVYDNTFSGAYAQVVEYMYSVPKEDHSIYTVIHYDDLPDKYEYYEDILTLPKTFFSESEKDAIIKEAFKQKNKNKILNTNQDFQDVTQDEYNHLNNLISILETYTSPKPAISDSEEESSMTLYDFMIWGDYNLQIQKLANKAQPEIWDFEGNHDNYILKNYLENTFLKLLGEGKIVETDNYCIFNTGLYSTYFEPIYVYAERNRNTSDPKKWYFKDFKDKYELGIMEIDADFPERADYFSDPSRLIFNWHYDINVNYKHILDDMNTSQRLPESFKNSKQQLNILKGAINTAIQRVIANYKLAIPHYYRNKIQLMIPLYLEDDNTPSVALVLNQINNKYYQATTCLTMQMAYMDARLIAKPESNWLVPEKIS